MAIVVRETKQRDFDAISELLKEEKLFTKSFTKYKFKRLLDRVIKNFDSLGIDIVFTHVVKTNDPSLKLFKSMDFLIQKNHYLVDRRKRG